MADSHTIIGRDLATPMPHTEYVNALESNLPAADFDKGQNLQQMDDGSYNEFGFSGDEPRGGMVTRSSTRHSTRSPGATVTFTPPNTSVEARKVVTVKPSMAPVQELRDSYPDWGALERELEEAKTQENAYFLDSSFLRALTLLDLWWGSEGPFFMPRREFRHRHAIFNLYWQPSAPNWEKSNYIVPPKLSGLLRWYLTRDNFINKESGNRLQDITDRLPQDEANALSDRGWSLYVMNMVLAPGNQLIFRKNNEREFQPYFGSTVKSQLRSSTLPEMTPDAFEALCRRLHAPDLAERISRLPDLTKGPLPFAGELSRAKLEVENFRLNELVGMKKQGLRSPTSSAMLKKKQREERARTHSDVPRGGDDDIPPHASSGRSGRPSHTVAASVNSEESDDEASTATHSRAGRNTSKTMSYLAQLQEPLLSSSSVEESMQSMVPYSSRSAQSARPSSTTSNDHGSGANACAQPAAESESTKASQVFSMVSNQVSDISSRSTHQNSPETSIPRTDETSESGRKRAAPPVGDSSLYNSTTRPIKRRKLTASVEATSTAQTSPSSTTERDSTTSVMTSSSRSVPSPFTPSQELHQYEVSINSLLQHVGDRLGTLFHHLTTTAPNIHTANLAGRLNNSISLLTVVKDDFEQIIASIEHPSARFQQGGHAAEQEKHLHAHYDPTGLRPNFVDTSVFPDGLAFSHYHEPFPGWMTNSAQQMAQLPFNVMHEHHAAPTSQPMHDPSSSSSHGSHDADYSASPQFVTSTTQLRQLLPVPAHFANNSSERAFQHLPAQAQHLLPRSAVIPASIAFANALPEQATDSLRATTVQSEHARVGHQSTFSYDTYTTSSHGAPTMSVSSKNTNVATSSSHPGFFEQGEPDNSFASPAFGSAGTAPRAYSSPSPAHAVSDARHAHVGTYNAMPFHATHFQAHSLPIGAPTQPPAQSSYNNKSKPASTFYQ